MPTPKITRIVFGLLVLVLLFCLAMNGRVLLFNSTGVLLPVGIYYIICCVIFSIISSVFASSFHIEFNRNSGVVKDDVNLHQIGEIIEGVHSFRYDRGLGGAAALAALFFIAVLMVAHAKLTVIADMIIFSVGFFAIFLSIYFYRYRVTINSHEIKIRKFYCQRFCLSEIQSFKVSQARGGKFAELKLKCGKIIMLDGSLVEFSQLVKVLSSLGDSGLER